ncbi:MAG: 50S ribosomal protein L9 [actinobacterium acAMD-2]|jgi:large subunit ribosomal protein L9|uniref:50S ribosomal protein L9 n=1 Tax=freshwater metagenome TaxID=449393 RepID=A0A6J6XC30_9ZZZZ|nr:MAG: 50S ribosomal protein L9 [actinobacterium acAMD-2]MSV77734.1 50S ribosomal protein L9 [Actinomycetota bacterium]MSX82941.1 50S ribosomal protein L9 [Actinomycetota bacterium]MSZ49958.1 50S ribosomal protein L9 [Actinomycetota bacterium]MTA97863.1 50S ribosomal protein L9 [Actinomycetota bacterium]
MKLILTQEVTGLGAPGDVVEVKDGYGRNFLVPRGLALRWTRGGEKQIVQIKRARSAREIRDLDHANDVKAQLGGIKVVLRTNAGDAGRLFGSVTTTDVAAAIVDAGGPDLDKRSISIATAIKTVGNHTVSIKLHPEVTVEQAITVAAH